jgi:hypothetical protein
VIYSRRSSHILGRSLVRGWEKRKAELGDLGNKKTLASHFLIEE